MEKKNASVMFVCVMSSNGNKSTISHWSIILKLIKQCYSWFPFLLFFFFLVGRKGTELTTLKMSYQSLTTYHLKTRKLSVLFFSRFSFDHSYSANYRQVIFFSSWKVQQYNQRTNEPNELFNNFTLKCSKNSACTTTLKHVNLIWSFKVQRLRPFFFFFHFFPHFFFFS